MYLLKWYQLFLRTVPQIQRANFDFGSAPKNFSSRNKNENYYDTLGISREATQSDIKSAYYKLSMEYHPDKNKGSESAAEKFRDISQAYEVLGNFRLRKLYDKGIIQTSDSQFTNVHRDEVVHEEDDPQTKFYKSRMKKSTVPHATGRTPIYDFDEWSRAHYGASFERRKAAKAKYDRQAHREQNHTKQMQKEILIFGLFACILGFGLVAMHERNLDVNRISQKRKS